MKKLLYFIILTFLLIPFAVRAEINLQEIHNSISKDNEITIKTFPLEQYKETDSFKSCVDKTPQYIQNPEEVCFTKVYYPLIEAEIKRRVEIPKGVYIKTKSFDEEEMIATVGISTDLYFQSSIDEDYEITFEESEIAKKPSKMKLEHNMYDLGYINQILNFGTYQNYSTEVYQSSEVFKIFPELKEYMEKNKKFDLVVASTGIASGEFSFGAGADIVIYHNDIAVDVVSIFYKTHRIVFVPDTIPKTRESYIEEAEKRIREYINDESYEVKIEFQEVFNYEYCELYPTSCMVQDVFEKGDEYSFEIYRLYINEEKYGLSIMPVPEKEIKKLKVKSKDYDNDISVETESSDVPLDTSVKAEDLTIKYKGFLKAYDIDLYSGIKDEYITQVKDGIIVRIPLPDEYDKKKLEIYHIKEDGTKGEKYKAIVEEIDGKKYAVFTTNHFSVYAIEEEIEEEIKDTGKEEVKDDIKEEIKQEETENPNTYDGIGNSIILLVLSILGIIGVGLYLRKKERNEI